MLAPEEERIPFDSVVFLYQVLPPVSFVRFFFLVDPILNWFRPLLRDLFLRLWWRSRRVVGNVDSSGGKTFTTVFRGERIGFFQVFRLGRSQLDFLKNRVDSLIDLFLRLRGHRPVLFHLLINDLL